VVRTDQDPTASWPSPVLTDYSLLTTDDCLSLADPTGLVDVGSDLLQEFVDTRKLAGRPQLFEELELDGFPIEIAGELEKVAVDPGLLDDFEVDPRLGTPAAQDRDISLAIMPKREVRPFHQAARGELVADDALEEFASREIQEPRTGPEHADLGGTRFAEQSDLTLGPDQGDRSLVRSQQGDGMRVERDGQRRNLGRVGLGPEPAQQA